MRRSVRCFFGTEPLKQRVELRATATRLSVEDSAGRTKRGVESVWRELICARPFQLTALVLVAALLITQVGREGATARQIGQLDYATNGATPVELSPPEKLSATSATLRELAERGASAGLSTRAQGKLKRTHTELVRQLAEVREGFAADRVKLKRLNADGALRRLTRVERSVDRGAGHLSKVFASIASANGSASRNDLETILAALDQISPEPAETELSRDLSFGAKNADAGAAPLGAGLTPAYAAPVPGVPQASLPRVPDAADLALTSETKITPEISELAEALGHDPVKIYQYVRNTIEYDPYLGIRKGAGPTLREKAGSDADQAALLVTLLRASDTPARFVRGVVEMPAAQLANWVGIDPENGETIEAAPEILAAAGIPTTQVRANGQLSKVRFEHVWVEAHVRQAAYRGVDEGVGSKSWVPLDPAFKRLKFVAPSDDAPDLTDEDLEQLEDRLQSGLRRDSDGGIKLDGFQDFKALAQQAMQEQYDNVSAAELQSEEFVRDLNGQEIVKAEDTPYLPATLPFRTVAVTSELRTWPAALTSSISLSIAGGGPLVAPRTGDEDESPLLFSAPTTEFAGKRVTVSYSPATTGDAEIIDAYHGLLNTPAYAASLIPVLRVDGQVVATGTKAVSPGFQQRFKVTYRQPGFAPTEVDNALTVGGITALALDLGRKSADDLAHQMVAMRETLNGPDQNSFLTDARMGQMLRIAGEAYFFEGDSASDSLAGNSVDARRGLSGALVATGLRTSVVGGFPVSVRFSGIQMDVDADNESVVSLQPDGGGVEEYISLSGSQASEAEASSLESTFGEQGGISTARIIGAAAEQGVPIHTVTPENAATTLPKLTVGASTRESVEDAVADGNEVLIPARSLTIGTWTGTGYIVAGDNRRGFMISGGLSGGEVLLQGMPKFDTIDSLECVVVGFLGWLSSMTIKKAIIKLTTALAKRYGIAMAGGAAVAGLAMGALLPILLLICLALFVWYLLEDEYDQDRMESALGNIFGASDAGVIYTAIKTCLRPS